MKYFTVFLGVILLPLIALDCLLNRLLGNSLRNTVSCEAWRQRSDDTRWGWGWRAIDAFFGPGHCHAQDLRETKYGSVWAAWRADLLAALAGRNT